MKELIDGIIGFILDNNKYYTGGYSANGANIREVFPDDTRGNYFYIRIPNTIDVSNAAAFKVSDCATAAGIEMKAKLVAVIRGGDPYVMVENMISTFQNLQLRVTSIVIDSEVVIDAEVSGDEERKIAKARSVDFTIISLNFVMNYIFKPKDLSCLVSPCTC